MENLCVTYEAQCVMLVALWSQQQPQKWPMQLEPEDINRVSDYNTMSDQVVSSVCANSDIKISDKKYSV